MPKVGTDDYINANGIDNFMALPRESFDDNPEWDDCAEWYSTWTKNKDLAAVTPSIGKVKCTDLGNGERLAYREKDNIHWSDDVGWRYWDGQRWSIDRTMEVHQRAALCVRKIYIEAAQTKDKEERERLSDWAHMSESAARINAMVDMAKILPGIAVTSEIWDQAPWLLNLNNGTMNLQTGEFREHRKSDYLTKIINVDYDPEATAPHWQKFTERVIPNADDRRFLQKAVGYSLTGSTREQCLFILYGTGQNGKSTFVGTIESLLGDYARSTPTETLMVKQGDGGIPNDIAQLAGARFVSAVETEGNKRLAESLVKRLTGGDKMTARFLRREFFTFTPTFKLWLAVNHQPRIVGTDEGIWRRLRIVPFEQKISESEKDENLSDKLRDEFQGILNYAIDGLKIWLVEKLGIPASVKNATDQYRHKSDVLNGFFDECCTLGDDMSVTKGDLYDKYADWAKRGGEFVLAKRNFGTRMLEKGFIDTKSGEWFWTGISLNSATNSKLFD